jgi:hypothetical protein
MKSTGAQRHGEGGGGDGEGGGGDVEGGDGDGGGGGGDGGGGDGGGPGTSSRRAALLQTGKLGQGWFPIADLRRRRTGP